MINRSCGTLMLALALLGGTGSRAADKPSAVPLVPAQVFRGKVMHLQAVLEKQGIKLDAGAAPHWLALVADDGKIYPLVKDDGSRMFYLDKRLCARPMQLHARLVPGAQLLQVVDAHSIIGGKLHRFYYWCDECKLSYAELGLCKCCGGETELVEELVP